jgi:MYXO-CTERM domain-containing protein
VNSGGTVGGTGSILGSTVTVNAGGVLAPGESIGTFTVGSAIIDGSLAIEFNGGSIDKLIVAGVLDISGATLAFTNLGTLTGSAHVIAQYGSLIGDPFAMVTGLPSGYTLNYNYLSGNQIALVASAQPGDFDGDGDVDGADFVAWQTNFPKESGATLDQGDADGDGDVDGADFVVWQTNFPFTPGPGTSPVPEPAGVALAAFGLALGWGIRRRRGSGK